MTAREPTGPDPDAPAVAPLPGTKGLPLSLVLLGLARDTTRERIRISDLLHALGALALLAMGADAILAVALHFAPLPWNSLLLAAVWRHPQSTPAWSMFALAWFVAMLVL